MTITNRKRYGEPWRLPVLRSALVLGLTLPWTLMGQSQSTGTVATGASSHHYMDVQLVQPRVSKQLSLLGPRFDTPGHERLTLTGTLTTTAGTVPVVVTRQLDEAARIDIGGSASQSLIAAGLTGSVTTSAAMTLANSNLLETVEDDTPESFFYGFQDGAAIRLLGYRFRTDDGKSPNYSGPYYDIYERRATVAAASRPTFSPEALLFRQRHRPAGEEFVPVAKLRLNRDGRSCL